LGIAVLALAVALASSRSSLSHQKEAASGLRATASAKSAALSSSQSQVANLNNTNQNLQTQIATCRSAVGLDKQAFQLYAKSTNAFRAGNFFLALHYGRLGVPVAKKADRTDALCIQQGAGSSGSPQ
jgi:hypothetical protein